MTRICRSIKKARVWYTLHTVGRNTMLVAYKNGKDHIFEEVTAITFHSNGIMKGIDIVLLCRDGSTKTVMTGISEGTAGKIKSAFLYGGAVTVQLDKFQ